MSQSLYGRGGMGKTQIALQYAHQCDNRYQRIIWLHAETPIALAAQYRYLGQQLLNITDPIPMETLLPQIYAKLATTTTLLIWDNAGCPDVLKPFQPSPTLPLHWLINSREGVWNTSLTWTIKGFSWEEALTYIDRYLPPSTMSLPLCEQLWEMVQGSPLVLAYAVAYLCQQGHGTLLGYVAAFDFRQLQGGIERSTMQGAIQEEVCLWRMVRTSLRLSLSKLRQQMPQAFLLLRSTLGFASQNISLLLLKQVALLEDMDSTMNSHFDATHLTAYHLWQYDEDNHMVMVHRIMQQVLNNDWMSEWGSVSEYYQHWERLAHVLAGCFKQVGKQGQDNYKESTLLIMHSVACLQGYPQLASPLPVANLWHHMGCYESMIGNHAIAEDYFQRALAIKQRHFGKEHVELTSSLMNLGITYAYLGASNKAKVLLAQALVIQERYYGAHDLKLVPALNNLANIFHELENYTEQKALLERVLDIEEGHYGQDHPQIAITLSYLADACGDLREIIQQKALLERALAIAESHYGKDHPQVAIILLHLADTCRDLGDTTQQKALLEQVLAIEESHYGKNHSQIAIILLRLADVCGDLGETARQKVLLESALAIEESHYGKHHPQVAITLGTLARFHHKWGNYAQQTNLLECVLVIEENTYGGEHPQVAITLLRLVDVYGKLGDLAQQKGLLERVLVIKEKNYGGGHPQVAITLNNLAGVYTDLGDYAQAKSLLERALAIFEQCYGKSHSQVGIALVNLGRVEVNLQHKSRALALVERSVMIFRQHYGEGHPSTQTAIELLNYCKIQAQTLPDAQMAGRCLSTLLQPSEDSQQDSSHLVALAQNYMEEGDHFVKENRWIMALECYEQAIESLSPLPAEARTTTIKGILATLQEKLSEAKQMINERTIQLLT